MYAWMVVEEDDLVRTLEEDLRGRSNLCFEGDSAIGPPKAVDRFYLASSHE